MRLFGHRLIALLILMAASAQIVPDDLKLVSDRQAGLESRLEALRRISLARIDNVEELFPVLLPLVREESNHPGLRALAVHVMTSSLWSNFENTARLRQVVPEMIECLQTGDPSMKPFCAQGLAQVRPSIPDAYVESLLDWLPHAPPGSQDAVLSTLSKAGEEAGRRASDVLVKLLGDDPSPRQWVEFAEDLTNLGVASSEALEVLSARLSSASLEVVVASLRALRALGIDALPALPRLRARLSGPDLGELQAELELTLEELERLQTAVPLSPEEYLRVAVDESQPRRERLKAFRQLGEHPPDFEELLQAVQLVLSKSENGNMDLEVAALSALGAAVFEDFNQAPKLVVLVPALNHCLKRQEQLRESCATALSLVRPAISESQAEPSMELLEGDSPATLKVALIETLKRVAPVRPRLNFVLLAILENADDPKLLAAAGAALEDPASQISERVVAALLPLIRHADSNVQLESLRTLASLGSRAGSALAAVQALEQDPESDETVQRLCQIADLSIRRPGF